MVDKRKREIRARMAATGENYTRAARELDKQQAPAKAADGADPTVADVEVAVRALLDRLRERRPEAGNPQCREPWEFTRAIDRATAAGLDLVDQLTAGGAVDQVAVERVARLAEQLQAAQRLTVNRLNFTMADDVTDAYALVRTARAVQQRRCLLGQGQASECAPGPERVRLRIHDVDGQHATEAGCLQHAAEEWTRWDHGGHVEVAVETLIGDPATAAAVAQLGAELRAGGPLTVAVDHIGEPMDDEDLTNNGLWDREGTYGSPDTALTEAENCDYTAVTDAWCADAAARLAARDITWDRATGHVQLPAGMTLAAAARAWQNVLDTFASWVESVVAEARAGAGRAESDDIRPDDTPGARWITYSTTDVG